MRCGRTFRLARTHPADARSSGSETLSRSRSLVAYTIDMHESEFSEATVEGSGDKLTLTTEGRSARPRLRSSKQLRLARPSSQPRICGSWQKILSHRAVACLGWAQLSAIAWRDGAMSGL